MIFISIKNKSDSGFKKFLKSLFHKILVRPVSCLLLDELHVVGPKKSHQYWFFINHSFLAILFVGLLAGSLQYLIVVRIETLLVCVEKSKQIVNSLNHLFTRLQYNKLCRNTVLGAYLQGFAR